MWRRHVAGLLDCSAITTWERLVRQVVIPHNAPILSRENASWGPSKEICARPVKPCGTPALSAVGVALTSDDGRP